MSSHAMYDPTIESTYHKTIRFRKVHFATDIVDTAGMVNLYIYVYIHFYVLVKNLNKQNLSHIFRFHKIQIVDLYIYFFKI
jgi:hypothetical protein